MKKICLVGPVDKRVISYPLIKCLMFLGKTLVITDDGVYRRFADDYGTRFSIGNTDFIVTPIISDIVESEVVTQYENILYITTNEIPSDCSKIIYARGVDKGFCTNDVVDFLDGVEHVEVIISYAKIKDETGIKIRPSKNNLAYISECEDRKEFIGTKDVAYATMLTSFFEDVLGVSKSTFKGLLQRKE